MSLLPLILSELDSLRYPRVSSDDFLDRYLDEFPYPRQRHRRCHHPQQLRPWSRAHRAVSRVAKDKQEGFRVNLDVQQFKPEELDVKVVDNCVVVEGKHEEREDEHGYVKRQFIRRYKLPANINPDTITSNLSSDGVLVVSASKKALPSAKNERSIPITQTEAPAVTCEAGSTDSAKNDKDKAESMEQ